MFVLIGLLPFVPSPGSLVSIIFITSYIASAAMSLLTHFPRAVMDKTAILAIIIVFILMPLNFLVSNTAEVSLSSFGRAIVPFLFLLSYTFAIQLRSISVKHVENLLLIASVVWAIKILVVFPQDFVDSLIGQLARLTYVASDMLVPFGMIGFILTIFSESIRGAKRFSLLLLFFLLIVASGYRSHILIIAAAAIFKYRRIYSAKNFFMLSAFLVLGSAYLIINPEYVDMMKDRIHSSAGDNVREAEMDYAFERFSDRPIFGNGLGHPIPVSLTRTGSTLDKFETDSVPYIHNFLGYVLMDLGIIGFVLFCALLVPIVVTSTNQVIFHRNRSIEGVWFCLISILLNFLVSASFRQIQMWVVISFLMYALKKGKHDKVAQYEA